MNEAAGKTGGSHACIVVSSDAGVRRRRALEIARTAVCEKGDTEPCGVCRQCRLALSEIHPDIIFINRPTDDKGKQKREIYVDQIRAMAADAWTLPQEAEKKVYIISEAGRMNEQAQNAALKILEEPPSFVMFVLCADSAEELLPTIRSRCMVLRTAGEHIYKDDPLARQYVTLAALGSPAELCEFFAGCESLESDRVTEMLVNVRLLLNRLLRGEDKDTNLTRQDAARIIELCRRAEDYLRFNVSVKHVLGLLSVRSIGWNSPDKIGPSSIPVMLLTEKRKEH